MTKTITEQCTHHVPYGGAWRPDEDNSLLLATLGKLDVLRKKAVAGVDRLGASLSRRLEYLLSQQVTLLRGCWAQPNLQSRNAIVTLA